MSKRADNDRISSPELDQGQEDVVRKLLGLGDDSTRKSYYPQLQKKIGELEINHRDLEQLSGFLDDIINSMPSALVAVDDDWKIIRMNHRAVDLSRIPPQKCQGLSVVEAFPELPKLPSLLAEALEARSPVVEERLSMKRDGEISYVDITVFPLAESKESGGVIRIDDITKRVQMEEMIVQSSKMMSVGGLAAGMAHEINNPLAGIVQNSQVMLTRMVKDIPKNQEAARECGVELESVRNYLERRGIIESARLIREMGIRASGIVENMLDFTRRSTAEHRLHDPRKLMDRTIELAGNDFDLKESYDFKRIRIIRQYDDPCPMVPCNASKIQQVFLNILENCAHSIAEKHGSSEEGALELRVKNAKEWVEISICDNGAGMEEEVRRRIFEPFFTTKQVGEGTGLGMSISYFIIHDDHKGTLTVESTLDEGSTFTMRLPAAATKK